MRKGVLEQIIQKLESDTVFTRLYNVTLENVWKDSFFIRVKRKENQWIS